jgi:nitrile hydratase subunit alpha
MSADHDHPAALAPVAARVAALESILVERGVVDPSMVEQIMQGMAESFGPMNGARVVARAWIDPAFHARLVDDATSALGDMGFGHAGEMAVVANTPSVHNVVVCTLCSCYPWSLLGLPPTWYKSLAYRSSMVRDARQTLAEMGTIIPPDVEIRVWDSSAEIRYLVLPERPAGTAGLDTEALAALVTRDSMIGVELL